MKNISLIDSTTQLLYSSQSQSFDEQYGGFSAQYAQMVIKDMLKLNVIEKRPLVETD